MGISDALRGPAAVVRGTAGFLLDSAETVGQAVAKDAPALRGPAVDALTQLASGLRHSATAMQTRVAKFDAPGGDPQVTAALATDTSITDSQRRVLLSIYSAFQEENAGVGTLDSSGSGADRTGRDERDPEFDFDGP